MKLITDKNTWDSSVTAIDTNAGLTGGETGNFNVPVQQLANRTSYLKVKVDDLINAANIKITALTNQPVNTSVVSNMIAPASVAEGDWLKVTVNLAHTLGKTNVPFSVSGSGIDNLDYDYSESKYTNGVTRNSDGTLNIPAGIDNFQVQLWIRADNRTEGTELINITIDGVKSNDCYILDISAPPDPEPETQPVQTMVNSIKITSGTNNEIMQIEEGGDYSYTIALKPPTAATSLVCTLGGTVKFNGVGSPIVLGVIIDDIAMTNIENYKTGSDWSSFIIPISAGTKVVRIAVLTAIDNTTTEIRTVYLKADGFKSRTVNILNKDQDTSSKYNIIGSNDVNVGPQGGSAKFDLEVSSAYIPDNSSVTFAGRVQLMYGSSEREYDLGQVTASANIGDPTITFNVPNYSADVAALGAKYAQLIITVVGVYNQAGTYLCGGSNHTEPLWGSQLG